ncbi:MAG: hypothetical protein ACP5P3_05595 [Ignavibacteria bacterium]
MNSQKKYALEVRLLEKALSEQFDIIAEKPPVDDFEALRLWVDNAFMRANKTVTLIKDVKSLLESKEDNDDITKTYNSPA